MLRKRRTRTHAEASDEQLRQLVAEHADAVYRVAYSVVRDPHAAEDIVQETIIRAWQSLGTWRGEGSMHGWIVSIAHNTSVSYLRRIRDLSVDPEQLQTIVAGSDVERQTLAQVDLDVLKRALDSLDELSRTIVVMRDLEALSYDQIATSLDVPLSTVKTRLLRARRELQRAVAEGVMT